MFQISLKFEQIKQNILKEIEISSQILGTTCLESRWKHRDNFK